MKRRSELDTYRDEIVRSLIETYSTDGKGTKITGLESLLTHMKNKNILTYELMKREGFEKQFDRARYWFPSSDTPLTDITINSILPQLKTESHDSFEDCKTLFQDKLKGVWKEPVQNYDLFFILDVRPDSKFTTFSVKIENIDIDVQLINKTEEPLSLPSFASKKASLENQIGKKYDDEKIISLHLLIPARNHYYAIKEGIQYVHFILGWIGFINNYHSGKILTSGFPHSYDNCPSPTFLLVGNHQKECVDVLAWKYEIIQNSCPVSSDLIKSICSHYSNGTAQARKIMFEAMNAYYTGLHEDNRGYALLAFWAALERLCLMHEGLSHDKMLNRLFNLIRHPSNSNEYELTMLLALRNDAIHNWRYDSIGSYERDLMKNYTELLIDFYLIHLMSLNLNEIELFYTKFHCTAKELEEHEVSDKKVFDLIKKLREKPKSAKVIS